MVDEDHRAAGQFFIFVFVFFFLRDLNIGLEKPAKPRSNTL